MAEDNFAMGYALGQDSNGGNGGMWGGDGFGGIWGVIILAMIFGWGNGGWGGFGGGNGGGALTRADLCADMNFSQLENATRGISQGICDSTFALNNTIVNGFNTVGNAVCSLGYEQAQLHNATQMAIMQGQNAIQTQLAQCCCENRAGQADIKYQMATDTCAIQNTIQNTTRDILDNNNANTRAVLDFLVQDKISTLQTENQNLKLAASQAAQNNYLISELRPAARPAYLTCSPFASSYGFGYGFNGYNGYNNGCGCGCGCNG